MFRRCLREKTIYDLTENSVIVPQRTLELIEPDPKEWDYEKLPKLKGWWAKVYFNNVKFQAYLTDEAHIDVGGYGLR